MTLVRPGRAHTPAAVAVALLVGGCHPSLPTDDKPDDPGIDDPPVDDTDPARDDTAPTPPCALPETEPNNAIGEANALPTDVQACGTFGATTDADFWTFTLAEDGWLAIDVDAFTLGSEADVTLTLSSTDLSDVAFGIGAWQDLPDVRVRFPSPPATYTAFVRQLVGTDATPGEGDDFFYDLIASSAKAPVSWDMGEAANDTRQTAQVIASADTPPEGVAVFGDFTIGDQDWYQVVVPPGRHTVTLDVDAHEFGSVADLALRLVDDAGTLLQVVDDGRLGWERDPYVALPSLGGETITVQVVEANARAGRPFWYTLRVKVEAQ